MLMALMGVMRQSELSLLRTDQMLDKGDLIEFKIGGLTKTRRVGQGPLSLQFTVYSTETKLDVVSCIRAYIARTFSLRQTETQLLIIYVKPHNKAQPCSVARWLQSMMQEAGIDTSIYIKHTQQEEHQHQRQKLLAFQPKRSWKGPTGLEN
jgi:hypothetical protein